MYLLDTNVFIQAKNAHYRFDTVPGFWEWIKDAHARGVLATIDEVHDEIKRGKDELTGWFSQQPDGFFLPLTGEDQHFVQDLELWARREQFKEAAVSEFMKSADLFLIAKAAAFDHVLVTHETQVDPQARRRVMIPNACAEFDVECINVYELMRRDKMRLRYSSQ